MPRRRIGALTRYFSIRQRRAEKDNLGERLNTYAEVFRVWGSLRNGRQRMIGEAGGIQTEDTLLLQTHYRDGFQSGGTQIAVDLTSSRQYRIDSVLDIEERRQWVELVVVEQPVEFPQ